MRIKITFYSYFKDLTGAAQVEEEVSSPCTISELVDRLSQRFPKLASMRKATLVAVGLEYCPPNYVLKENDEVSLFPPVQGG